jgi:hypothetical protein
MYHIENNRDSGTMEAAGVGLSRLADFKQVIEE